MLNFIYLALLGYLCGSLSSAIIVCKVMRLPDPRSQGSKNPGATNVMRIGGRKAAIATFLGDFFKGLLPVLFAQYLSAHYFDNNYAVLGAALGAFLGHLYPLYFGFKGGKGVATLVGVLLGISPLILLIFVLVWVVITLSTGYVSLASILATVAMVVASLLFTYPAATSALLAVLAVLVIYRHRENIVKLRNGTENQFRKKDK